MMRRRILTIVDVLAFAALAVGLTGLAASVSWLLGLVVAGLVVLAAVHLIEYASEARAKGSGMHQ